MWRRPAATVGVTLLALGLVLTHYKKKAGPPLPPATALVVGTNKVFSNIPPPYLELKLDPATLKINQVYRLETSTDMVHWSLVTTFSNIGGTLDWREPHRMTQQREFFRMVTN